MIYLVVYNKYKLHWPVIFVPWSNISNNILNVCFYVFEGYSRLNLLRKKNCNKLSNILQSYPATLKYRFSKKKNRFCILICIPLNWCITYWFDQQNVRPKYKFSSTHPVDIESYMQNIRRLNVRKWLCFFYSRWNT